jgi:hypothetical protein
VAGRVRTCTGLSLLALAAVARAGAPAPPEPAPSAELLLFLAEFNDARGNPVDPIDLGEQPDSKKAPGDAARKAAPVPTKHDHDDADPPRH